MESRPSEIDGADGPAGGAPPAAVEISKPRNDKRLYRRVVLPNSLECLLISDPDTDKAAASMNVSVGYFCDPEGLEGLAHFLGRLLASFEASYYVFVATCEHVGGCTFAWQEMLGYKF